MWKLQSTFWISIFGIEQIKRGRSTQNIFQTATRAELLDDETAVLVCDNMLDRDDVWMSNFGQNFQHIVQILFVADFIGAKFLCGCKIFSTFSLVFRAKFLPSNWVRIRLTAPCNSTCSLETPILLHRVSCSRFCIELWNNSFSSSSRFVLNSVSGSSCLNARNYADYSVNSRELFTINSTHFHFSVNSSHSDVQCLRKMKSKSGKCEENVRSEKLFMSDHLEKESNKHRGQQIFLLEGTKLKREVRKEKFKLFIVWSWLNKMSFT